MKAKAHIYLKDHINTDEIIPARYLNTSSEKELAKHAMEDLDKNFIHKVKKDDVIIAGKNFGCGSSREHAVWALRGAGIKAVIAKSFARIFYRNAINNGFLAIEYKDVEKFKDGEIVDLEQFGELPDFVKKIMKKGGLLNTI